MGELRINATPAEALHAGAQFLLELDGHSGGYTKKQLDDLLDDRHFVGSQLTVTTPHGLVTLESTVTAGLQMIAGPKDEESATVNALSNLDIADNKGGLKDPKQLKTLSPYDLRQILRLTQPGPLGRLSKSAVTLQTLITIATTRLNDWLGKDHVLSGNLQDFSLNASNQPYAQLYKRLQESASAQPHDNDASTDTSQLGRHTTQSDVSSARTNADETNKQSTKTTTDSNTSTDDGKADSGDSDSARTNQKDASRSSANESTDSLASDKGEANRFESADHYLKQAEDHARQAGEQFKQDESTQYHITVTYATQKAFMASDYAETLLPIVDDMVAAIPDESKAAQKETFETAQAILKSAEEGIRIGQRQLESREQQMTTSVLRTNLGKKLANQLDKLDELSRKLNQVYRSDGSSSSRSTGRTDDTRQSEDTRNNERRRDNKFELQGNPLDKLNNWLGNPLDNVNSGELVGGGAGFLAGLAAHGPLLGLGAGAASIATAAIPILGSIPFLPAILGGLAVGGGIYATTTLGQKIGGWLKNTFFPDTGDNHY